MSVCQEWGFAADGQVDLNTGTAKELQQLPGIGKGLAKRIVDYRTANGPFKTVEDLIKVKGIGKKTFAKMRDRPYGREFTSGSRI